MKHTCLVGVVLIGESRIGLLAMLLCEVKTNKDVNDEEALFVLKEHGFVTSFSGVRVPCATEEATACLTWERVSFGSC